MERLAAGSISKEQGKWLEASKMGDPEKRGRPKEKLVLK